MCQEEIQGTNKIPARPGHSVTCRVPYTCGELWQGTLDGEQPALVSLPIDAYSSVAIEISHDEWWHLGALGKKAVGAANYYLEHSGRFPVGYGKIDGPFPQSKGLGTSTADISATLYAVAKFQGKEIGPNEVADIAISIEPSNGTMFPGFCVFDHRGGKVHEDIGARLCPKFGVIILGFHGEVDTVAYNRDYRVDTLREMKADHREALVAIKRGFRYCNLEDIGYGAILSARCHQRVLYKPQLEKVIKVSKEVHAIGVNVAHSGMVIGVLIDLAFADTEAVAKYLKDRIPCEFVYIHHMVSGGPRYDEDRPTESCPSV